MDDEFFEKYLSIIKDDENSIHDDRDIMYKYTNPDTFEECTGSTKLYVLKLANEIKDRMKDFEPSGVFFGPNIIVLGFANPLPSKRITGELYKNVIRVTFEVVDRGYVIAEENE